MSRWSLLLALAALVAGASADCKCVNNKQTYDPISNPLIAFFNPTVDGTTTGTPCSMPCTYTATFPGGGFTGLQIASYSANGTVITFSEGGTTIAAFNSTTTTDQNKFPYNYKSFTDTLKIEAQPGDVVGRYVIVARFSPNLRTTDAPTTTTPAPVTTPYHGDFGQNPALISLDLAVFVDSSTGNGNDMFLKAKQFAQTVVKNLEVVTQDDKDLGTRLSLITMIPIPAAGGLSGAPWHLSQADFNNGLNGIAAFPGPAAYFKPATDSILNTAFSLKANNTFAPRKNAQRVALYVVTSAPADQSKWNMTDFVPSDVHVVVVGVGLTDAQQKYYTNLTVANNTKGEGLTYFNYNAPSDANVNPEVVRFVKTVIFDGTQTCPQDPSSITLSSDGAHIQSPLNYGGPAHETTVWSSNFQRYCNYINQDFVISNPATTQIQFTVFYELEVEKDYLRFYDMSSGSPVEVVSLTGMDVTGSSFTIPSNNVKVTFSTDNQNVFGGFHIDVAQAGVPVTTAKPPTD